MSEISLGSGLEHIIDNVRRNVWADSVVLNWINKIADVSLTVPCVEWV